jgi:hypothetical protein
MNGILIVREKRGFQQFRPSGADTDRLSQQNPTVALTGIWCHVAQSSDCSRSLHINDVGGRVKTKKALANYR